MTDSLLQLVLFSGLLVCVCAGWVLTLMSLPGNWLILVAAAGYAWLTPGGTRWDISLTLLGILAALAVAGEVLETAAAAAGVKKVGGSRRGALLAIVGSIVGALFGTGIIPIPIVGTLLGACLGAVAGAILGETWKGSGIDQTLRVGHAAFWGRFAGSLAKIVVASTMVAVTLASAVLH